MKTNFDKDGDVVMTDKQQRHHHLFRSMEKGAMRKFLDYDKNTTSFWWKFPLYDKRVVEQEMVLSPAFVVGVNDSEWRLLAFPSGNRTKKQHLSIYLQVHKFKELDTGWTRFANFQIRLLDLRLEPRSLQEPKRDADKTIERETVKRFNFNEPDWGFREFCAFQDIENNKGAYVTADKCIVLEVTVNVRQEKYLVDPLNYNSKETTGFVGLLNQGCTCYLNALLQTLFHARSFRQAVYSIPIADVHEVSIPLTLQKLFFKLEKSDQPVDTRELTKSFGWTSMEAFSQHDIQELTDILFDRLEAKKCSISDDWKGRSRGFIKCTDVQFESFKDDDFTSICLNVRGTGDVNSAFKKFCETEVLDGENKYNTEDPVFKYQKAQRGIAFLHFPKILMVLLKRYEYNYQTGQQYKVNDRFDFGREINLAEFLHPGADSKERNDSEFVLYSVLVHSGEISSGHYYSIINIDVNGKWFKFDDEKVYNVLESDAVEKNFGRGSKKDLSKQVKVEYGESDDYGLELKIPGVPQTKLPHKKRKASRAPMEEKKKSQIQWQSLVIGKYTNAYVLYYVKKSAVPEIFSNQGTIPDHLFRIQALEKALLEKKRKEKREAHTFVTFKIVTDMMIKARESISYNLVDFKAVRELKVSKALPLGELVEILKNQYVELKASQIARIWKFVERRNRTVRPSDLVITRNMDLAISLEEALQLSKLHPDQMNLFVEGFRKENDVKTLTKYQKLLFFKLFLPGVEKQQVIYVGHYLVNSSKAIIDYDAIVKAMIPDKIKKDDLLVWYEEISNRKQPRQLDPKTSIKKLGLHSGDVLLLQKHVPKEEKRRLPFPDIPDYYAYLKYRRMIRVRKTSVKANKNDLKTIDKWDIEMMTVDKFDEVRKRIADKIQFPDFRKIRLWGHNPYFNNRRPAPFKKRDCETLQEMIVFQGQKSTQMLYFDLLDCTLEEMERKKELKIFYFENSQYQNLGVLDITLDIRCPVRTLIEKCKTYFEVAEDENIGTQLFEIKNFKIIRGIKSTGLVKDLQKSKDSWLRFDVIPREHMLVEGKTQCIIQCIHVDSNSSANNLKLFGDPFYFVIDYTATLKVLKKKLQEYMGVPDEQYKSYKFCPVLGKMRYKFIEDDQVVFKVMKGYKDRYKFDVFFGIYHRNTQVKKDAKKGGSKGVSISSK